MLEKSSLFAKMYEVNKINGYKCKNENYEVVGTYCILYDIVEAKHY